MGFNVAQKILKSHIVEGELGSGGELALRMDQTLTQDATGTMAYLEFEAMDIPRVRTELSVAYIDHNTLQSGFENADDHEYIRTVAKKKGLLLSRPGNGICHQVHLERFAVPGKTLIGADSHTPTAGGMGMLAIGAGGLDVAVAMAGGAYHIADPKIVGVKLSGAMQRGVSAKDIILEVLRILSVKGGVGRIIEYFGDGVLSLSVPERSTITNMGAELGATTSIFPSDENTLKFLKMQDRTKDYTEIKADGDAKYDEVIEIDLCRLVPLAACPYSPDRVVPVSEIAGLPVNQVCIGSCTNSSLRDLSTAAAILKGNAVPETVSLAVSPGSRQVLSMIASDGVLNTLLASGARMLECACGPCIGMGQAPASGGISLRTFNRNFEGRSGTADAKVYLVSPETAAASAVMGVLTDPRELCGDIDIKLPGNFLIDDSMIAPPAGEEEAKNIEIIRGPNIKPLPRPVYIDGDITARVSLKVGDNITTDHIMPAGAKLLPYRSNLPKLSEYCFTRCDEEFPARAKEFGQSIIIGGENYGQGSSREHAALAPMYLGVRAVIVKGYARIHMDNLVNVGILPLVFCDEGDYDRVSLADELRVAGADETLRSGGEFTVENVTAGFSFAARAPLTERQRDILLAGGLLEYTKKNTLSF